MHEDDKKAWDYARRSGIMERTLGEGMRMSSLDWMKIAFQAGRDSKGDGWCFDMDKAPRDGTQILVTDGNTISHAKYCKSVDPQYLEREDGLFERINVYSYEFFADIMLEYCIAWKHFVPPQPPQDRKEGS